MCRLAAYLGPPIRLDEFLLKPPHSLVVQSYRPQEMRHGTLNADGFGFGWYTERGESAVYTSTLPIWSDTNLSGLGISLASRLWLANVRSATPGQAISQANTQPFVEGRLMFLHNGLVRRFAETLRPRLHRDLPPAIQAGIAGNTDSEYLFAMLRARRAEHPGEPLPETLAAALRTLADWGPEGALLNIVVSDGERVCAVRHALGEECPSLYYSSRVADWPGACVLASERLSEAADWVPVPEHHLLVLEPQGTPQVLPL